LQVTTIFDALVIFGQAVQNIGHRTKKCRKEKARYVEHFLLFFIVWAAGQLGRNAIREIAEAHQYDQQCVYSASTQITLKSFSCAFFCGHKNQVHNELRRGE
jgi:hypothetical protein